MMKTIRERIDINAPRDEAFHQVQLPLPVTPFTPLNGQGKALAYHYLKYDNPRMLTLKLTDGLWFIETLAANGRFLFLEHERTAVIAMYTYEMKAGLEWMEPLAERFLRRDLKRRLGAAKDALEEEVDFFDAFEERLVA